VQYPIRVAANLTGLSIDTLRAWERRYQAVTPLRGERGREYDEKQIQRLILLRNAVDRGHAIGQVASLSDAQLEKLLAGPATAAASPDPAAAMGSMRDGLQTVVAAIESFDCATANSQLSRMAALLPAQDFVGEVVIPLMHLVGDRWHDGTMTIAQEHMISSILRNLLGGMVRLGASSGRSTRILFATPAGELHEFGILVSAMLSVAKGFEALYLGTNLPAQEIVDAGTRTSPRAVVLGIKASMQSEVTREEIRMIASNLPRHIELWLGGDEVKKLLPIVGGERVMALEDLAALELNLVRLRGEANEAVLEVPV
jgi:methanogenic corrinoid protein MtbC1